MLIDVNTSCTKMNVNFLYFGPKIEKRLYKKPLLFFDLSTIHL